MVRRIFLTLENEKFEKLLKIKGNKTWERLLVDELLEKPHETENQHQVAVISEEIEKTNVPAHMIVARNTKKGKRE